MSEMTLSWLITVAVVVLTTIGFAAILLSAVLQSSEKQGRALKLGSLALSSAGLILVVDGIVGIGTSNVFLVGMLMMILGSCVSPVSAPENVEVKAERDSVV